MIGMKRYLVIVEKPYTKNCSREYTKTSKIN